jgi:hypothetical protein
MKRQLPIGKDRTRRLLWQSTQFPARKDGIRSNGLAISRFMAVPHYTYLVLKIPGPNEIITVKESFEVSDICDKEFHKLAQTFGKTAEYARLKGDTDHNMIPDVGRSLPDQAFNTTWDSKKVWVHLANPDKTTSIAVDLDPA